MAEGQAWYKDERIREIIKEVAEKHEIAPNELLGALVYLFDTILEGMQGVKVKAFRIFGLGIFNVKGYIPKAMKPKKALGVSYGTVVKYKKEKAEAKKAKKELLLNNEDREREQEELI